MMRSDKLLKVNKWNKPAFMPKENLFYLGGGTMNETVDITNPYALAVLDAYKSLKQNGATMPTKSTGATGNTKSSNTDLGKAGSTGGSGIGSFLSDNSDLIAGVGSSLAPAVGGLISGDYESGIGTGISGVGDTAGKIVSSFNPVAGAAISVGSQILGGLANRAFGISTDEAALQAANAGISAYNNFNSNAGSFDDVKGVQAQANFKNPYSNGWFTSAADEKNERLKNQFLAAKSFAERSVDNNVNNLVKDQLGNDLYNYAAFGGPLTYGDMRGIYSDGGGIHIKPSHEGRLTELKKRTGKTEAELWAEGRPEVRKMITFARNARNWQKAYGGPLEGKPQDTLFAFGGDMQSNGADYLTGLTHINAGGSHEESPYDGVQIGVDNENTPNLVEEGETIFNDYVYSNRIKVDEETKKRFHLPKKRGLTYADVSKKLEKEISEHPNDPISKAAFKAQMEQLAEEQERQKQEMEAERAKAAFEALSPEEQAAVMQQVAQQQAMAEDAAAQQQVTEPSPEEVAMAEQQLADDSQAAIGAQPVMHAMGGNLYPGGGTLQDRILKYLNFTTDKDFYDFANTYKLLSPKENEKWGEGELQLKYLTDDAWRSIIKGGPFNTGLKERLIDNPGLLHAIQSGLLTPEDVAINSNTMFNPNSRGQWTSTKPSDWWGDWNGEGNTPDYWDESFKQLYQSYIEAGKTPAEAKAAILKLNREDFQNALMGTQAYKDTSKWLETEDNALQYLTAIAEGGNNIPQKAKEHALSFIRKNNETGKYEWIPNKAHTYQDVFGTTRTTYPGSYWKTALPAINTPTNTVRNFEIDADGKIHEIITDVPSDWTRVGDPYSWSTKEGNMTHNYYRRPKAADAEAAAVEDSDIEPKHKADWLRYAGLFGPAVGLGLQMAGIGKPEYSMLEGALKAANSPAHLADYQTLGNYLTYRPMDIWFEQNKNDANARATDRAMLNTSSPMTTKYAGLLANSYNSQLANGELYRKALEYNDAQREKVAAFNRGTDQFNADAYNKLSMFNADALNRGKQYSAQLGMQAAAQKMAADAGWNQGIYGNVAGLFKGLSELGRENAQHNMIADMAADGLFGTLGRQWIARDYIDKEKEKKEQQSAAKGGKISTKKHKRGLTF